MARVTVRDDHPPFAPQAFLFDLDGVLVNSMRYHAAAWQCAVRTVLGTSVPRLDIYRREGERGSVTAHDILRLHRRRATPAAVRALLRWKETAFMRRRTQIRPYPVARPLLALLQRSKLPLALVTGTSRAEVRRILPAWMRRRFTAVITGDQVRHGKPHPEPYRAACRRLRQDPRQVVVVENAPFGIASARAAGIGWVVGVATSLPAAHLRQADVVLPSLKALHRYLHGLLSSDRRSY